MAPQAVLSARSDEHIPALDGVRALAALLVLWEHLPYWIGGRATVLLKTTLAPGYLGVDVFFVLSGFLITRILVSDHSRGSPLKNFLARRFLRIFPIYYLTVLAVALWRPGAYVGWAAVYLSNFYFATRPEHLPLHHTWSLAVEEHFYIAWPLAVYAFGPRGRRLVAYSLLGVALFSAIGFAFSGSEYSGRLIYMGTMCRAGSLALGALIAFSYSQIRARASTTWYAAGLLLGLCGVMVAVHLVVPSIWKPVPRMVFYSALSASILLGVLRAHESDSPIARVLSLSPLRAIGRISYGLYLYHYPIYIAFSVLDEVQPTHGSGLRAWLAVIATLGLATFSYFAIERPALRLKTRFR